MFCPRSLAQRIDAAEARLTRSVGELLAKRDPATLVAAVGEGVGVATVEDSPFEKVIGAGFGDGDLAALIRFEESARSRGRNVRVEVSTLADPAFARALTARGYVLDGFENVLGLALEDASAAPEMPTNTRTREIARSEIDTWIDTVVTGFAAPDSGAEAGIGAPEAFSREPLTRLLRDMADVPGYAFFLGLHRGDIAGGASMRIDGDIAQLTGAATLLAHRRYGIQTALLHQRLRFAAERKCELAVVTTQPGSKSQENAMRQGFRLLYARSVLICDDRTVQRPR